MDILDQTLKEWRQGCFEYGQCDCMLSLANYITSFGWPDYSGKFRGMYDSHEGAEAVLEAHGGIPGIIAMIGLPPIAIDLARRFDIFMVEIAGQKLVTVCTGDGVAGRLERGVIEINRRFVNILGAWSVINVSHR